MTKKKFARRDWYKVIRLSGRGRKKLKWRRSKGIHSKLRSKKLGYPASPEIGYGTPRSERGLVKGKNPIMIFNVNDLKNLKQNDIGIISGKVGAKKRIEIAEKALEMKLLLSNMDPSKFIEDMKKIKEKKIEQAKEKKEEKKHESEDEKK